ncbi:MAG: hypothetical protein LBR79_05660 [Oscillospiraceae bacterium]|nr:hypothetical protein [Oscillospiraceae bacterium]
MAFLLFPPAFGGCGPNLLIISFPPRLWRGEKKGFQPFWDTTAFGGDGNVNNTLSVYNFFLP